jgi:hypothetical protein
VRPAIALTPWRIRFTSQWATVPAGWRHKSGE